MNQNNSGRFAIALGKRREVPVIEEAVPPKQEQNLYEREISKRALRIYQNRVASGMPGTAESDWQQAEMEYRMSPIRVVWAEGLNDVETARLREQVELTLKDPNYSIVCNYPVNWMTLHPRPDSHRIIWADSLSAEDVESLRQQVDTALLDPDFTIVTNYEVHWDEHE